MARTKGPPSGKGNESPDLSKLLVPMMAKIQNAFEMTGGGSDVALPSIVAVGSQSAGKSSVLESIIGHNILPRGTGIVTRVPLVLQLHAPTEEELEASLADPSNPNSTQEEWAEFTHIPDTRNDVDTAKDYSGPPLNPAQRKRFFDFDEVRNTIELRTNELAGDNKGVVNKPIHVKVTSPRLLELTLVDLPGFTKMPVGDQPEDIQDQIRDMCFSYVRNPNTIVLAITAANTDLSNSDALQVAKEVDPQGNRTVGVLTKVDLMDRGTDCVDVLLNQVIPLKLGFVAVVNRGQQDVKDKVDVSTALSREREFFAQHPVYGGKGKAGGPCVSPAALKDKLGTGALVERLSTNLVATIKACLPGLRTRLTNMLQDTVYERKALGEALASEGNGGGEDKDEPPRSSSLKRVCLDSTTAFALRFRQSLDGTIDTLAAQTSSGPSSFFAAVHGGAMGIGGAYASDVNDEGAFPSGGNFRRSLPGGEDEFDYCNETGVAAITRIFEDQFLPSIAAIDALDGLSDDYIRRVIDNTQSFPPSLFVAERAFHALVKEQIARLEQPGAQCVELVHGKLLAIATSCLESSGSSEVRFPLFVARINELVAAECAPMAEKCKAKVRDMIDWELGYVNTKHPDFVDFKQIVKMLSKDKEKSGAESLDAEDREGKSDDGARDNRRGHSGERNRSASRHGSRERGSSKGRRESHEEQPHQSQAEEEEGGPFWRGWFGGGGDANGNSKSNSGREQPRPRRGGRRSSFGILDPQELEKFRAAQFSPVAEAMAAEESEQQNISIIAQCRDPSTLNEKDLQVYVVQQLIRSYFDIVARDFCDKVPKAIMATLVNCLKENLQNELITALYDDVAVDELMKEPEEIGERRIALKALEESLNAALTILNDSTNFSVRGASSTNSGIKGSLRRSALPPPPPRTPLNSASNSQNKMMRSANGCPSSASASSAKKILASSRVTPRSGIKENGR